MEAHQDRLADARLRGRREAEDFDRRLRQEENREREERLAALELAARDEDEELEHVSPAEVWRLRQEVERLTGFQRAVLGSRSWSVLQRLRRLVGRAW
jgi:predicted acyl esterase